MGIADRLRSWDSHSSVSKEFRVYTAQGAIVSVITCLIIGYLTSTELAFNFRTTTVERVHVNASSPAGLELEFDITLPSVPCVLLHIDASDPTGQPQSLHLDRQHHVWKHRVKANADGSSFEYIGDRTKLELGSTLLEEPEWKRDLEQVNETDSDTNETATEEVEKEEDEEETKEAAAAEEAEPCGSCYGAEEEGECCNTCDDVKRAYTRKGWVLQDLSTVKQCEGEMADDDQEGEGCNVHGIVALSTGGGNLHLAPGRNQVEGKEGKGLSVMDILLRTFEQWNVSHTVHKLRFGKEYPGHVHQLDNQNRTITDAYGMYQYYFQVVPTLYRFLNGTEILTNQYSVTEHLRHVNPGSGRGLPGVFFIYEVSPLHVEISEEYNRGWVHFFTSICAIVGGVVTVMGMVDQYLYGHSKSKKGEGLVR